MANNLQSIISFVIALIVLFSAMIDPIISEVLSVAAFIGFAIYKFEHPGKKSKVQK